MELRKTDPEFYDRFDAFAFDEVANDETAKLPMETRYLVILAARTDLIERLSHVGLPLCTIEQLQKKAESIVGMPDPIHYSEKIVGIVAYRNNTVIDVIHAVEE